MKQAQLRRFERLYHNARHWGADRILRRYLGLPDDYVIPVGLAHGVDFGQMNPCQDVITAEPIHWAHNDGVYRAALTVKAAVRIPHAVLLTTAGSPPKLGDGRLVVGPPPGPVNDQRLLDILGPGDGGTTILVKPKRHFERSIQFWQSHGYRTATLADRGPPTYDRLVEIFSDYDRIVGCTFSSAVIFGAAMGMRVELLKDFTCSAYEVIDIDNFFVFQSERSREIVRMFVNGSCEATTDLANQLLGSDLSFDANKIRAELDRTIERLTEPVYVDAKHGPAMRWLILELAALTGRPEPLRYTLPELLRRRRRHYVYEHEMNEISAFLNGADATNLRLKKVPYVPGETVPGDAIERYSAQAR